jgi:hypothetical protein
LEECRPNHIVRPIERAKSVEIRLSEHFNGGRPRIRGGLSDGQTEAPLEMREKESEEFDETVFMPSDLVHKKREKRRRNGFDLNWQSAFITAQV